MASTSEKDLATVDSLGARTSVYGFTNIAPGPTPKTIGTQDLKMVTNYSTVSETPTEAVLSNKTCPLDQEELITYRSRRIPTVQTNLKIANPGPVKEGIQYQVIVEDVLRTTDSADPSFVVDEPIVVMFTIRHPYSSNFSEAKVTGILERAFSACVNHAGEWRLKDLMRGAERPYAD